MKIRNELFIIILYAFSVMNADAAAVVSRSSRASISRAPTISVNTNTSTTTTTTQTATTTTAEPEPVVEDTATEIEYVQEYIEEENEDEPIVVENKSLQFSSSLGDAISSGSTSSDTTLADMVRAQRAALDAAGNAVAVRTTGTTNTCDADLRACMTDKCGKNFTKCASDTDTMFGTKLDSCRRNTKCDADEYKAFTAEIKADRVSAIKLQSFNDIIDCGKNYDACIVNQCGATYSKCLGKSAGDNAISKCNSIAKQCNAMDSGLASRTMSVFGTLRQTAEKQISTDEKKLYTMRDQMRSTCARLGAMLDDRSLDCVYTVNFLAGGDSTLYSSKKAYAGNTFDCTPAWFGVDVTTYMENAYRTTRAQSAASSAMLGAGVGMAVGAITSGAIGRAIETQKADKELCEAQAGMKWSSFRNECVEDDSEEKEAKKQERQEKREERKEARQEKREERQEARKAKRNKDNVDDAEPEVIVSPDELTTDVEPVVTDGKPAVVITDPELVTDSTPKSEPQPQTQLVPQPDTPAQKSPKPLFEELKQAEVAPDTTKPIPEMPVAQPVPQETKPAEQQPQQQAQAKKLSKKELKELEQRGQKCVNEGAGGQWMTDDISYGECICDEDQGKKLDTTKGICVYTDNRDTRCTTSGGKWFQKKCDCSAVKYTEAINNECKAKDAIHQKYINCENTRGYLSDNNTRCNCPSGTQADSEWNCSGVSETKNTKDIEKLKKACESKPAGFWNVGTQTCDCKVKGYAGPDEKTGRCYEEKQAKQTTTKADNKNAPKDIWDVRGTYTAVGAAMGMPKNAKKNWQDNALAFLTDKYCPGKSADYKCDKTPYEFKCVGGYKKDPSTDKDFEYEMYIFCNSFKNDTTISTTFSGNTTTAQARKKGDIKDLMKQAEKKNTSTTQAEQPTTQNSTANTAQTQSAAPTNSTATFSSSTPTSIFDVVGISVDEEEARTRWKEDATDFLISKYCEQVKATINCYPSYSLVCANDKYKQPASGGEFDSEMLIYCRKLVNAYGVTEPGGNKYISVETFTPQELIEFRKKLPNTAQTESVATTSTATQSSNTSAKIYDIEGKNFKEATAVQTWRLRVKNFILNKYCATASGSDLSCLEPYIICKNNEFKSDINTDEFETERNIYCKNQFDRYRSNDGQIIVKTKQP